MSDSSAKEEAMQRFSKMSLAELMSIAELKRKADKELKKETAIELLNESTPTADEIRTCLHVFKSIFESAPGLRSQARSLYDKISEPGLDKITLDDGKFMSTEVCGDNIFPRYEGCQVHWKPRNVLFDIDILSDEEELLMKITYTVFWDSITDIKIPKLGSIHWMDPDDASQISAETEIERLGKIETFAKDRFTIKESGWNLYNLKAVDGTTIATMSKTTTSGHIVSHKWEIDWEI